MNIYSNNMKANINQILNDLYLKFKLRKFANIFFSLYLIFTIYSLYELIDMPFEPKASPSNFNIMEHNHIIKLN